jgi:LuxR family maltose regulon positive regulatory protein
MQAVYIAACAPEGVTQMRRAAELHNSLGEGANLTERTAGAMLLGLACWLAGDTEAALRGLREAEEIGGAANIPAQIAAYAFHALILADDGRWDEARRSAAAGRERVEEVGLSWGFTTLPLLVALARTGTREGDPTVAECVNVIGLTLSQGNVPNYQALLYDVLVGEILAEQGDLAEATRWMHAGFAHLALMPDAGILRSRLSRLRDLLERRRLLEPLTPAERRVLDLLPTELTLKKVASRLYVSLETVRTHVRDIYRKLDTHSRSEAVARARELGLLGLLGLLAES